MSDCPLFPGSYRKSSWGDDVIIADMKNIETELQFIRGEQVGGSWKRSNFSEVKIGAEGQKGSLDLEIGERVVEHLFEKEIDSLEEAQAQLRIIQSLRKRNIPTFKLFKLGQKNTPEGTKYVAVMEDRTEGGKRWLITPSNQETWDRPDYWSTIKKMSADARNRLVRQVFDLALAAGKADENGVSLSLARPEILTHPLMLDIDPKNPDGAMAIVGDVGMDVVEEHGDPKEITLRNVRAAYTFLNQMLGYFDDIPQDHEASRYRHCYSEGEWQDIKGGEQWFNFMLSQQ